MCCIPILFTGCANQNYTPQSKEPIVSSDCLINPGVLTVGVDASNVPYAAESQGEIMGIDVDIAAALADQMGLGLELVDVGKNIESAFSDSEVDIVMGVEDTSSTYWTSNTYMESEIVLFALNANASIPTDDEFLVAAQQSSMSAWQVTDLFGDDYLVSKTDLKSAFESLQDNSVDFVAADSTIGGYVAHSSGITAYPIALLQSPTDYHIACAEYNDSLQSAISQCLEEIDDGGIINVITSKWLGEVTDLSSLPLLANPKE